MREEKSHRIVYKSARVKIGAREGRGRDLNPGARLHRPIGYQATSPRPLFIDLVCFFVRFLFILVSS